MTSPETPFNPAPSGSGPTVPQPPSVGGPQPKRSRRWITPTLALVAVAVVALFGGILIGQHTAQSSQAAGFTRGTGQGFGQRLGGAESGTTGTGGTGTGGTTGQGIRQGAFGGATAGTIESIKGDTIVVKARDGSTVTVTTSGTTTVTKSAKSSVSGLATGQTITVRGTTAADGSVTATSVSEGAIQQFGARPGATGTGN